MEITHEFGWAKVTTRALITGGAGFIGSHLVRRLAESTDWSLTVLDNLSRGRTSVLNDFLAQGRVSFVHSDIRDHKILSDHMKETDLVFHLAAQSNVMGAITDIDYSFTTNVVGTFNVFKAAEEHGARRVIFTSSREVYGEPTRLPVHEMDQLRPKNAYGASKVAGEVYADVFHHRGLDIRVVRLANVYGPYDRDRVIPLFIGRALQGEPLHVYGGNQVLDFVWIEDVVDALVHLAVGDGGLEGAINVASGQGTTVLDLARLILKMSGSTSQMEFLPERQEEVSGFVGATERCTRLLGRAPAPPLMFLGDVMAVTSPGFPIGSGGD